MLGKISIVAFAVAGLAWAGRGERLPEGVMPPDAIRADHPRLFFNADTWPAVVERANGPARAQRDALLARCDSYPDNPKCRNTGPVERRTVTTADGKTATNAPYSAAQKDFEQLTAHRPFAGTGRALRFSTRLMPSMMRIAYGPVQVKAEVIIWSRRFFPYSSPRNAIRRSFAHRTA